MPRCTHPKLPYAVLVGASILAMFAAYAWLAVRNPHVGLLADDALYLLMAEIYSPYRQAVGAVYEHVWTYSQLPSLYPLLLALAGGGVDHLLPARLATAACLALAWLVFHRWLRGRGVPRGPALALALFCAATPVTLLYAVDLWSEGLYVLLALTVLVCAEGLPRHPSAVRLVGLAVLVGCAMQARSIGIALVPAVLLGVYRQRAVGVPVFAVALAATLGLFSTIDMGAGAPSYSALMFAHYAPDPPTALRAQLASVWRALPGALRYDGFLLRSAQGWQAIALGVLAIAVLRGLLLELRARSVMALYVIAYLAITVTWPFPDLTDRFLYPLLPLLCFAAWRGARVESAGPRLQLLAPRVALALLFALAAPGFHSMVARAMTPVPDAALDTFRTTRYWLDAQRRDATVDHLAALAAQERAADLVRALVPEGECVYTMSVQLALLRGRRPSFLPPPPARMNRGPPWGCRYFLLSTEATTGRPPFYPGRQLQQRATGIAMVRLDEREQHSPPAAVLMRVN